MPTASGHINIYQWLPFSQQALAQAAAVATEVTRAYNTFTYTETAAAYLAPMNGLITSQLSQTLKNGYTTPGVAQPADQPEADLHRHGRRSTRSGPSAPAASRSWSPSLRR